MSNTIKDEDKSSLFDTFFADNIDSLAFLDPESGQGQIRLARDPFWIRQEDDPFDYEAQIAQYVLETCADPDPAAQIRNLNLHCVQDRLAESRVYRVYLVTRGEDDSIRIKDVAFSRTADDMIVMMIRDLTGTFSTVSGQVQLLQQALDKANNEISQKNTFLSLMSRSIRSPLHSIMGLTRIAQQDMEGEEQDSALEGYLHKISMSGTYMSETIDDILDLRRISQHEIILKPEKIELGEFISQIETMILPVFEDRGLMLIRDTAGADNLTVQADYHSLQQIIMKLLLCTGNYTLQGGRIILHVKEVFRSGSKTGLEISVESRGITIDRDRLSDMFQPYNTLGDKLDDDLEALDIALIILKSYALAMGANTITTRSGDNGASVISIVLTLPLVQIQTDEEGSHTAPDLTGRRALLVDDNHINLEVGEKLLRARGMDVVCVSDGQQAVDTYRKEKGHFDMVFMDIIMPKMDGLEAARQIRSSQSIPGASSVPIIAMTATAFPEDMEKTRMAGMNAHLIKPISPERMYTVISEQLHL